MFLKLSHRGLDVYRATRLMTLGCYSVTKRFPTSEKFAMVQQIRRAALSVHLNLAEGCSRKSSAERRRFFEISRGSLVEVDECLGLAVSLEYVTSDELKPLGHSIIRTFQMLSKMM